MRYNSIIPYDTVNTDNGFTCSIFFQGCTRHCVNCFNKETWDFSGGIEFTPTLQQKFIDLCNDKDISCVSILGGEPLDQDMIEFVVWLKQLKQEVKKPIYLWSSYTMKEIKHTKYRRQVLKYIDVLIDGRYIDELHDFRLKLRGSSNQHIWRKGAFGFWKKSE